MQSENRNTTTPIVRARPIVHPPTTSPGTQTTTTAMTTSAATKPLSAADSLPNPGSGGPMLGVARVDLPENMPAYLNAGKGAELVRARQEDIETRIHALASDVDNRIAQHYPHSSSEVASAFSSGGRGGTGQVAMALFATLDAKVKALTEAQAAVSRVISDGLLEEVDAARKQLTAVVGIIERAGLIPSGDRMADLGKGAIHFGPRRVDFNTFMLSLIASLSHKQFFLPAAAPAVGTTIDLTKLLSTGNLYGANVGAEVLSRYTELVPNAGAAPVFKKGELESTIIEIYELTLTGTTWAVSPYMTKERRGGAQLTAFSANPRPSPITEAAIVAASAASAFAADVGVDADGKLIEEPTPAGLAAADGAPTTAGTYYLARHTYRRRILGRIGGSINFALLRKLATAGASMAFLPQGAALAPVVSQLVENFLGSATDPAFTTSVLATSDALGG